VLPVAEKRKRDYYVVLGVEREAGEAELKRAFRELARKYHPAGTAGAAAEDRFKAANEAYAVLSDPRARARYDRHGFAHGQPPSAPGFQNVAQAMEDLFGDVLRRRKKKKRGRDLRYTLEVTLEDVANGREFTITVPEPVSGQPREFTVEVSPGTLDGAVKTLRGEGAKGQGGAPAGDLCVVIRVAEHSLFDRRADDIHCDVFVSFPEAALGALVEVPTLSGNVKMKIPEGTQSGRVFRMREKGMPKANSKTAKGDQLVRVLVETPTGLTDKQRSLLEAFAKDKGEALVHPKRRGFLDKLRDLLVE